MSSLWISLLEVQPLPDREYVADCEGAFVNGITLAHSAKEAESAFDETLQELGWSLVATEETENFQDRCAKFEIDEELKELALLVQQTQKAQFGTFHTWD